MSISIEDIAARYSRLPGFRLVSYHRVALPFWIATFDALIIGKKTLPVLDEFILRSIEKNVSTRSDLAGFLGLSEKLIVRRLGALLKEDYIVVKTNEDGSQSSCALTAKGELALKNDAKTQPKRERIAIPYDGIARRPIIGRIDRSSTIRPQEIKRLGLFEIPALPTPRPPDEDELGRIDFDRAVPKDLRKSLSIHQVLSATKKGSLDRRAREAVMLVFCGINDQDQLTTRFFSLDGRPLPEIDRGFSVNGGLQKLRLLEKLQEHRSALQAELSADPDFELVVQFAAGQTESREQVAAVLAKGAQIRTDIAEKEASLSREIRSSESDAITIERLKQEIADLKSAKAIVERQVAASSGRAVEPHEHAGFLSKVLNEATSRVMIISPWIKDSVMRSHWAKIEKLLKRKVRIFIGYGMRERVGDDAKKSRDNGENTLEFFERMASTYGEYMCVIKLGDTHAKVLAKDSDVLIAGSFNWMSFAGYDTASDGRSMIRDEISILVTAPGEVDKMFQRYLARFSRFDKSLESQFSR